MSEVKELEEHQKDLLHAIHLKDIIVNLEANKDFQEIMDLYCISECARLTALSTDDNLSDRKRADCIEQAKACAHFAKFLSVTKSIGFDAEDTLAQVKEHLVQLAMEEDSEND